MIDRRKFAGLAASALAGGPAFGQAQKLPEVVRVVVPFPPGGTTDLIGRVLAERLRGELAETLVVENRTGAGGRLAVQALRQAPPDGTVLMVNAGGIQSLYPHTFKQLGYDPQADVAPISTVTQLEFCWAVGPAVPAHVRRLKEYVDWVRADPQRGNYATPGAGTSMHFLPLFLARSERLDLNPVHYRGTTAALPDLLGGQVPAASAPLNDVMPHVAGGRLRVLATSGEVRHKFTPEVATFGEQGHPQLTYRDWFAVFVHGRTPAALQEQLSLAVRRALARPETAAAFAKVFIEPSGSTPAQALDQAQKAHERWGRVVKDVGYEAE